MGEAEASAAQRTARQTFCRQRCRYGLGSSHFAPKAAPSLGSGSSHFASKAGQPFLYSCLAALPDQEDKGDPYAFERPNLMRKAAFEALGRILYLERAAFEALLFLGPMKSEFPDCAAA